MMAFATDDQPFCCICREDLTADTISLLRPRDCPIHTFHRDCIVPWLQEHRTCPVCSKRCDVMVDGDGRSLSADELTGVSGRVNVEEETAQQLLLTLLLSGPSRPVFPPSQETPRSTEEAIEAMMFGAMQQIQVRAEVLNAMFLQQLQQPLQPQPVCDVCGTAQFTDSPPVKVVTCGHLFHLRCVQDKMAACGNVCPSRECRSQIVALINCHDNTIPFHDEEVLRNDPSFRELAAAVGIACEAEGRRLVCVLCEQTRTGEVRVIPNACQHVFHKKCLDERVGGGERRCPVCARAIVQLTECGSDQ